MKYFIASQSLSKNEEQSERFPGQLGTSPASRYVVLQQSPPSFRLLFSFPLAFSLLRAVKEGTKEEPKPQGEQQEEETNTLSHLSEEEQMKLLLGIGGFDSTKGKAVEENLKSAAVGTARQSFDEASQTVYYYNIHTGETSWTLPEDNQEGIDLSYLTFAVVRLQSMFRGIKDRKRARRLVTAQYQCTTDPDSGKILYTNLDTNTSSWTKPALFGPLQIPDTGELEEVEEEEDDDDDFEGFQQDAARDAEDEEIIDEIATDAEVELDEATKKKVQRKYPRSKAQQIVDAAEDAEQAQLLDMSGLDAWKLSSRIWNLPYLKKLVLSNNYLTRIPSGIQDLIHLEELDVSHNQLTRLPSCLQTTRTLTAIRASHNLIQTFSPKLWKLREIRHLDLSHNQLKELPIGLLHNLETLKLFSNQLRLLPKEFGSLSQLRHLDLDNNPKLINLGAFFRHLPRVEFFSASSCGIVTFESLDFLKDSPVERLRLSQNALQEFPLLIGHAAMQDTLQELVLSGNYLTQLTKLDISFNRLCSMPTSLMELTQLQSLYASDNLLSAPPPAVFHVKCFCEFSNNPFTTQQHQQQQNRRDRLALALKLVDMGEFGTAEELLTQLIAEVKTIPYVEQGREKPRLHYKRGLCRFMLLKYARQAIDDTSAMISNYEQEIHGVELNHTHHLRLKGKQKKIYEERPESPDLLDNNDSQPEDSVKEAYTQAVHKRAQSRQNLQLFANGALADLHEAIKSECIELTTAFHLKGLVHMALRQYPDAIDNFTKALKEVHAVLPDPNEMDNQQEEVIEELGPVSTIPEASIQLFLCRAEAYRGLGQLPSAIADLHHVISHYPLQNDSTSVVALKREYVQAWEAEQAGYNVDDAALLRAFNIETRSGLARRPQVLDVHAEALAAATAKKKAGNHKSVTAKRLSPAERFRLDCEAHTELLTAERRKARAPFEEISACSRVFLARARDFKREIRANLQMGMEENQQRTIEREIAREAERRRLEHQREGDEQMIMKYEDEWMHWFVSEEFRLENERKRRADEAQSRADAKVAYAARLAKRGGKRQAAVGQRGKSNSKR
ncbi:hypothetical protein JG688_00015782 [Phytophthora aleatoria]|uniref:WW domain-containing protein n=1 Tax=Phytophthora aleatoria TaxID=2496075 RepID=A0A8J5LZC2_9STRA|nr:hypothetical protein JG688_00015782 [Phytophthora aleatoria]